MTERKPPGVSWETWIDRQIREAMERGEFENLPGAGKPLADLDRPRDDMWWVRDKLRREEVSYLPPALELRKQADDAMDAVVRARTEDEVRRIVADINERIRYLNSHLVSGPPSTLMPFDVEEVVRGWRAAQP